MVFRQTQDCSGRNGILLQQHPSLCASYSPNRPRATLHACMGDTRGGSARVCNILQHDLEWSKEEASREALNLKGRQMLERLLRNARRVSRKSNQIFFRGMAFTGYSNQETLVASQTRIIIIFLGRKTRPYAYTQHKIEQGSQGTRFYKLDENT